MNSSDSINQNQLSVGAKSLSGFCISAILGGDSARPFSYLDFMDATKKHSCESLREQDAILLLENLSQRHVIQKKEFFKDQLEGTNCENIIIYWICGSEPKLVKPLKRKQPDTPESNQETLAPRKKIFKPFRSPAIMRNSKNSSNNSVIHQANLKNVSDPELRELLKERCEIDIEIRRLDEEYRLMSLSKSYKEGETDKINSLTKKWRTAAQAALVRLRDSIGITYPPQSINNQQQGNNNDSYYDLHSQEPRLLNLKELCTLLRIDINIIGNYDESSDEFSAAD